MCGTPQCCGYYYILLYTVPVHELNTDGNNVWYSEVLRILLHTAIYRYMSCIQMVKYALGSVADTTYYILLYTAIYQYMSCIQMVIMCTPQCFGYCYILLYMGT